MQKIKDLKLDMMKDCQTNHKRIVKKALWLLSTARNAIVVIICSVFAYLYTEPNAKSIVVLTGKDKLATQLELKKLEFLLLDARVVTEVSSPSS